jgi:hypothetical protein
MPKRRDKNKVKLVAKAYIQNGADMVEALKYVEGDKTYDHANSIAVKASRWRFCPEMQAALKKELALFDKGIVNDIYVLANLYEIINDKMTKQSDRVNALSLVAKVLNIGRDQLPVTNIVFADVLKDLKTVNIKSIDITASASTHTNDTTT